MNISALTLRDLEYLVAVADQKHFGKAAQSCHVSQPALSAQVRKAEDFLGHLVFERSNRNVSVTAIGQLIVDQARVVLEEARKIAEIASSTKEPLTGAFRLGLIATVGPYLMPHLLGPLKKRFPQLELVLKEGQTETLVHELRNGALDAVIASPTFPLDGLKSFPLFKEPFLLAVSRGHPLCVKKPLHPSDLDASEMLLLEDGHCLADQAIRICPPNRRGNFRKLQATSLETLRHLVASGSGYTILPALAVRDDSRLRGLIHYREFDGKGVGRAIILLCRERFSRMGDAQALAEFIRANVPGEVEANA